MSVPSVTVSPVARDVDVVCCTDCCPVFRRSGRLHIRRDGEEVIVEISPPKDVVSTTSQTLNNVKIHLPQRKDSRA